ncbi:flavin-containing monooxygenase [Devosia naphthalenivorans]|uniref:flavin-containing monooxygenase n=1 Tax=Devosia naphthalenivorans TaxID=2082392 RepID=UPI000D376814|nr:NAD(P)/FAD-dependent oxidoreductase [Devosia naphthalenivorans]
MTAPVDVLVIGGGQAGLAASWRLVEAGASHVVIDASQDVGDSWRRRYHSLTLFTPRSLSALPGLPVSGDPDGYASRIEFADYLAAYAGKHRLPVMSGTSVTRLVADPSGFAAELDGGTQVHARAVIVCTGPFQQSVVPQFSRAFADDIVQLTVGDDRNPMTAGPGTVLVVGDGASGRDIAVDLARTHKVVLATGKRRRLFPERILGQSTWTWMDRLGLLSASAGSPVGRIMQATDPFPNRGRSFRALRAVGVDIRPRLHGADGRIAIFADGSRAYVGAIIWATGYRNRDHWIEIDLGSPGLFFLGRPWQRNRASGLILGASRDSVPVAKAVLDHLRQSLPQPPRRANEWRNA